LEWKRLKVFVKAKIAQIRQRLAGAARPAEAYRAVIASPDRQRVERELREMVERGVRQLHLFTVSTDYIYNYEGQLWDMYPSLPRGDGRVVTERYPAIDHTFSIVAMQRQMIDRVCRWLSASW
jgi:hypothetical protein